jgi:hypothetical protein
MRSTLAVLTLLASLAFAPACGGGGDDDGGGGGGGDGDGAGDTDGGASSADAASYAGLGQACEGEGQGNCPTGFQCIALEGGNWCSKLCESHPQCQEGYTGPGLPACIVGVDTDNPADGEADFIMCGIVCEGIPATGCDDETCDGTCPGGLTCTSPVTNMDGDQVGKACE